jgi:hypothetical protein
MVRNIKKNLIFVSTVRLEVKGFVKMKIKEENLIRKLNSSHPNLLVWLQSKVGHKRYNPNICCNPR